MIKYYYWISFFHRSCWPIKNARFFSDKNHFMFFHNSLICLILVIETKYIGFLPSPSKATNYVIFIWTWVSNIEKYSILWKPSQSLTSLQKERKEKEKKTKEKKQSPWSWTFTLPLRVQIIMPPSQIPCQHLFLYTGRTKLFTIWVLFSHFNCPRPNWMAPTQTQMSTHFLIWNVE